MLKTKRGRRGLIALVKKAEAIQTILTAMPMAMGPPVFPVYFFL